MTLTTRAYDESGKTKKIQDVAPYIDKDDWLRDVSTKITAFMLVVKHHTSKPGQGHYLPPKHLVDGEAINFFKAADIDLATPSDPPRSLEDLMSDPRQLCSSPGVFVKTTSGEYRITTPEDPQQPTKIVLYYMYPRFKKLLKSALKVFGLSAAWVDGDTKPADRTRIFNEFNRDAPHFSDEGTPTWILCFTPIGAVGLNFPRGTVVFILVSMSNHY